MKNNVTRRGFIRGAAAGAAALSWLSARRAPAVLAPDAGKPARLGGRPAHTGGWPPWPDWREAWEPRILKVLRSGNWSRGREGESVPAFEQGYAALVGAKRCLGTASGTTALITSLHVLGVDAGDEVVVSPFTFIATASVN